MNKAEYLAALAYELRGLPLEEQRSALQYYEDYFADAGEENEARVISELGSPQAVAQEILQDFRELAAVPQPQASTRRGISPWLLVGLLLLVLVFWPVALGLIGAVVGILVAIAAIAVALSVGGVACGVFGVVTLFGAPLSGGLMIGTGCMLLAVGILLGAFLVYVCIRLFPPIIRAIVRVCRKPFEGRKRI